LRATLARVRSPSEPLSQQGPLDDIAEFARPCGGIEHRIIWRLPLALSLALSLDQR